MAGEAAEGRDVVEDSIRVALVVVAQHKDGEARRQSTLHRPCPTTTPSRSGATPETANS